mmetsp:Transcript_11338/g.15715  ORF Transcript_11338/g.15715 Transcript_11338/m.15715 type:complete len:116 (-) Transcript_11338:214-561(-)
MHQAFYSVLFARHYVYASKRSSSSSSPFFIFPQRKLNTRGVQHNTNFSTNTLRRQIPSKPALYNTVASMCPTDTSPVNTEPRSIFARGGSLGDIGNTLSEVEFNIFFGIDALDLD